MARAFQEMTSDVVDTYRNKEGQTVRILKVRGRSWEEFKKSNQGYILEVDGVAVGYTGDSRIGEKVNAPRLSSNESKSSLLSKAKDEYGDDGILMTESDYKSYKEGEESKEAIKREIQKSQIMGAEELEKVGELQRLETSKGASETAKMLETALLAGGMTPGEAGTVTSKVTEDVGSIGAQLGAGTAAAKAGLSKELAGLDISAITTGKDVEQAAKTLASNIELSKQQLAQSAPQSGGGLKAFLGDILGSGTKTIAMDMLGRAIGAKDGTQPRGRYAAILDILGLK